MKTCYSYVRVSSDLQETNRQHTNIINYCKDNGIEIIKTFEEKESGTKRVRKALTQLIDACKSQHVNYVIIDEQSRLGRTSESITTIENLIDLKICVISIKENLKSLKEDGSEDSTQMQMFYNSAGNARGEIKRFKERTKEGKIEATKQGIFSGGSKVNVCYGYRLEKKIKGNTDKVRNFLVIDEFEVKYINEIYNKFLEGVTVRNICRWLNSTDFKPRESMVGWNTISVYHILKNELYIGVKRLKSGVIFKDDSIYPQIISNEVFEKVQDIFKSNINKTTNNQKYDYLFTNKIIKCECCGKHFYHSFSTTYQVYMCSSKKNTYLLKGCDNYGVNIKKLESFVQDILFNYLPDQIQEHIDTKDIDDKIENIKSEIIDLNKLVKIEGKKEDILLDQLLNGLISPDKVQAKMLDVNKEKEAINRAIKAKTTELNQNILTKENALNMPLMIAEMRKSGINKDLLHKIVKQIRIDRSDKKLSTVANDRTSKIIIDLYTEGSITFYLSQRSKGYLLEQVNDLLIYTSDAKSGKILKGTTKYKKVLNELKIFQPNN